MKKIRKIALLLCVMMTATLLLTSCGDSWKPNKIKTKVSSDTLYVEKVDNLKNDFIMGMDASCVPSLEASGVKYYDFDGNEKDVYQILAENGINYIRVRVWNDPFDKDGNGYGGGNCDIENAIEVGKRATEYGMKLLVNFHYSDFWADPSKQMVPKAWKGMTTDQKADALYLYTKECLEKLVDAGVDVGMVQIGNETNGMLCGESATALGGWKRITQLFSAGSKAVREVCPDALVAVHFANPEKVTNYESYSKNLDYYGVDYDVFASSYYPYWHGTLENLATVLNKVTETYGKKVMIAETSYAYTAENTDEYGNTIGDGGGVVKDYPFTVQGQANMIRNLVDVAVNDMKDCIGVFYWEGTWISVGSDYESNLKKWEKYGSGWASSYSAEYDPDDAGKWYGGCAVDNQAFFDKDGKALESLKVFALMKKGNKVTNKADAIEDVNLICDLNGDIVLPSKVNAVMLDDSKQEIDVVWHNVDYDAMKNGGVQKYDIVGTAGGMTAHCYVSMVEYNYLGNWSFEDDTDEYWQLTALKKASELKIEDKVTDSLTGTKHYHFYGASANTIEFTLEQTVESMKAGEYYYTISIMGGDCGNTEIYSYVEINGVRVKTAEMQITVWDEWDTAVIDGIEVSEGDSVTVGIYVKCDGAGAWGKIDDAMLNKAQ